jgi:mannose-6-phosphate isomerase-like protein (cupin superfamily)
MLSQMTRVLRPEPAAPTHLDDATARVLVPGEPGSTLALDTVDLGPGASLTHADDACDTVFFAHAGSCALRDHALDGAGAFLVGAGESRTLVAGPAGASLVRATLDAETDLHAPMGAAEPVVALDHVEPGKATGARSFQVLYGPHNGSTRATLFVGYIPPGKAPWHYHLYDEIVWVLRGAGRLHIGDAVEPLEPGCAFRLRPREVHVVENTDPAVELAVLGIFTPAGSPSAAYLQPDVAATYAING